VEDIVRMITAFFIDKKLANKRRAKIGNLKLLILILFLMVFFTYIYEITMKS